MSEDYLFSISSLNQCFSQSFQQNLESGGLDSNPSFLLIWVSKAFMSSDLKFLICKTGRLKNSSILFSSIIHEYVQFKMLDSTSHLPTREDKVNCITCHNQEKIVVIIQCGESNKMMF